MRSTKDAVSDGDSEAFARRGGRVWRKRRRRRFAEEVETSAAAARSTSSTAVSCAPISGRRGAGVAAAAVAVAAAAAARPAPPARLPPLGWDSEAGYGRPPQQPAAQQASESSQAGTSGYDMARKLQKQITLARHPKSDFWVRGQSGRGRSAWGRETGGKGSWALGRGGGRRRMGSRRG